VVPRAVLDGLTYTVFVACVIMIRIGENETPRQVT
jgi:hypothetical protein